MLKAIAAVLASALGLPAAAVAGEPAALVTGAIRDEAGVAVAGARIEALDAAGHSVGRDIAAADGTFALNITATAATVRIDCDYCAPLRLAVARAGDPVVAIVQRYRAVLSGGPTTDDIRALPYRSAADVASLQPFTVVSGDRVSDRGLAPYGANLIDGLPFYSAVDGDDYSRLIPARAVAALGTAPPSFAPAYGGYASAGIYDYRLNGGPNAAGRADVGNGDDLVGRIATPALAATVAGSADDSERRGAAAANLHVPFAGGTLTFSALDAGDGVSHAAGSGLSYLTESRRYTTSAVLQAAQTGGESLVRFGAELRNDGPLGLTFGVRELRATAALTPGSGAQTDAALYAGISHRDGTAAFGATVAADRGSDAGDLEAVQATGVAGSVTGDVRVSPAWSTHSAIVSNLRVPTFGEIASAAAPSVAGDRTLLFEQSLTYTESRRLRIAGSAFTQRTTGTFDGRISGIGLETGWQIAPRLALRAWLLNAHRTTAFVPVNAPAADGIATASSLTRQAVWLTYDGGVRVDAVVRGDALEGDVRIPLDATYAVALGTARYANRRVTTVGITLR